MSITQTPNVKSFETRLFINGKVCLPTIQTMIVINKGQFVEASDGGKFDLISPTTGEKFTQGIIPRSYV